MSLTLSERATLNFYEWEYRGRGYYLFENQISIEPPYTPFRYVAVSEVKHIDDGKVPNLLERVLGHAKKKERQPKKEYESPKIVPKPASSESLNTGFSILFQKGEEISSLISQEFLNLLSYSVAPISFEIIGTYDVITIQIVCAETDEFRIKSHIQAYFPTSIIKDIIPGDLPFDINIPVAICDFGLNDEFVRSIESSTSFSIDPLTSIIATLENLQYDESALLQIIFQGVSAPWARDIPQAVSDGLGGSFFTNSPEMPDCAKEKIASPLFSCILRLACQGNNRDRSKYLATQLIRSITTISTSEFNKLIPLSNESYAYDDHLYNVYHRTSNRFGMILNSNELVTFIHYPNKSIASSKLGLLNGKTKLVAKEATNQKYVLGVNEHNGIETKVMLADEVRLRHIHIIGATGVGKSTLIANMILEDLRYGNGCALFDPHGDIVDDILNRIPNNRKDDVVVIDPSDQEYAMGFNLLQAHSEIEKIVLSSDLVSAFKQHATSWGDNMTAVLSNGINTFLDSNEGGTLIELKRFLLEDRFREQFLETVEDQSILYYWKNEYPMVRKGIAPLLTRIDTFLRPKIVRYMLAQKSGIDFRTCIKDKKIVLIKLAQGLIGEENSYLLGSLFLSKFNQAAQSRQNESKVARHPYFLYLDEFQNFITPSITSILSGARKYGLGLVLAHQELAQIEDSKVFNSVISNPNVRICFRLGDADAKKLESGFSYFDQEDLQSLGIGQAIMRVGSSRNDFNLQTTVLPEFENEPSYTISKYIIDNSRKKYGKKISEVQTLLTALLPKQNTLGQTTREFERTNLKTDHREKKNISERISEQKKKDLANHNKNTMVNEHRSLQMYVKTLAQQRGFKASIEEETDNGGRVDIGLTRDNVRIAVEISVTNTLDYEVKNIRKCIDAGYNWIYMISKSMVHLNNIKKRASETIEGSHMQCVQFLTPLELTGCLDSIPTPEDMNIERIQGYRVTTNMDKSAGNQSSSVKERVLNLLLKKK